MIKNKEFTQRLTFIKENNNWYIDLPNWTGSKSALQMVSGADTLLDVMSKGKNCIDLLVSNEDFDGASVLKKVRKCWFNGSDYILETYDVLNNHKVWLCDVTKYVIGYFPDKIYFAKFNVK